MGFLQEAELLPLVVKSYLCNGCEDAFIPEQHAQSAVLCENQEAVIDGNDSPIIKWLAS